MKKLILIIGLCLSVVLVGRIATADVNENNLVVIETDRTVGNGTLFPVAISVRSAINLAAYQMDLSFNPSVLEAVQVEEGSFMSSTGKTYWFDPKIDNGRGVITGFLCGKTDMKGVYGDGKLVNIIFKAKSLGTSSIALQNVKLSGPNGRVIISASLDGSVTVTEPSTVVTTPKELSISSASIFPGSNATVQIMVDDATGIASGDILMTYDSRVITVVEVRSTDLISSLSLIVTRNVPGELRIGMAGAQGIPAGSGTMVEIDLTADASEQIGTQTVLRLDSAELYDASGRVIPIGSLDNGFVTIAGTKGDVNNDGLVRSNDAILTMRIVVGLLDPTPQQMSAADMNGDGVIRSNDAILILRKSTGLAAPGLDLAASVGDPVNVTLDGSYKVSGERLAVPVRLDNAHMVAGGDISIAYDPTALHAVDVSTHSGVLVVSNSTEPGEVRIAFAAYGKLSGQTIAEVQFDILSDDVSPLTIQRTELYDRDARLLVSRHTAREYHSMPPKRSALLQNFPNPFNPETWLPYSLAEEADVTIRIYDVQGRLIRALDLGHQSAGFYLGKGKAGYWDGRNEAGEEISSGTYFYTIKAGSFAATKKMIVTR